jgi:hypothetical protein
MANNSVLSTSESYEIALNKLFSSNDEEFEVLYQSMWAGDITVRIDGKTQSGSEFYSHLNSMRAAVQSSSIKLLRFLRDGNQFADRHYAEALMKDGSTTKVDAYAFGEIDEDGRIKRFEEAFILVGGAHPMRDDKQE